MATGRGAHGSTGHTVCGTGPPVLLLAGWGSTADAWGALIPRLAARHMVIAVDNRDMLHRFRRTRVMGVNAMADHAVAVLDAVGAGAAHVVGNSLGGLVAQSLAERHPQRVRSLVLLSTSLGTPSLPSSPLLLFDGIRALLRRSRRRDGAPPSHDERWSLQQRGAELAGTLGWCGLRALSHVRARTLVIHGSRDRVIPLTNARVIARLVPCAQLLVVAGAGHLILTDAPDQVGDAITDFLSGAAERALGAGTMRVVAKAS